MTQTFDVSVPGMTAQSLMNLPGLEAFSDLTPEALGELAERGHTEPSLALAGTAKLLGEPVDLARFEALLRNGAAWTNRQRRRSLEQLIDVSGTPAVPECYRRIAAMASRPGADLGTMARSIEDEPALIDLLLETIQRFQFGNGRANTVPRAAAFLGVLPFQAMVLWAEVRRMFPIAAEQREAAESLQRDTAHFAQLVAELSLDSQDFQYSFMAALLSNVGKLVLLSRVPRELDEVETLRWERDLSREEAQREVLGFDHLEVTLALLMRWGVPSEVLCAVGELSSPMRPDSDNLLSLSLKLADSLMRQGPCSQALVRTLEAHQALIPRVIAAFRVLQQLRGLIPEDDA